MLGRYKSDQKYFALKGNRNSSKAFQPMGL